jgi:hypothetical protein
MILNLEGKLIVGGVILASLGTGLFIFALHQRSIGRAEYAAQVASTQVHYKAQAKKVTTEVITKYIHDIQVVREKGNTIIKKVPIYVTVKDDAACTINTGFVSLWNDSNSLRVSSPSRKPDDSPSSVILSDVAAQHVTEANIYHETATRLIALQDWIRRQQQVK